MKQNDSIGQKVRHAVRFDRAMRFVFKAAPGWTFASMVVVLVQGVLPLVTLYLMKLIVDAVTFAISAPDKRAAFLHVAILIALAAGVALVNAVVQLLSRLVNEAQTVTVTDYMYDILHAKSIEVDLEYYENPQYFDTLHRAQQEGPYRPTQIVNSLVRLGQDIPVFF